MRSRAAWVKTPDVVIPLAHTEAALPKRRSAKLEFVRTVNEEYVTKLLEGIGVEASSLKNRRLVERCAPLAACDIDATWIDSAAVASSLRIAQPRIGSAATTAHVAESHAVPQGELDSAVIAAKAAEADLHATAVRTGQRLDAFEKLRVKPPDIPTSSTVHAWLGVDSATGGVHAPPWKDPAEGVFAARCALLTNEMAHSEAAVRADTTLVAELEKLRGGHTERSFAYNIDDDDVTAKQALEDLKLKFILPFACFAGTSTMVPWQITERQIADKDITLTEELMTEMIQPIAATVEQIAEETSVYAREGLPLGLLTSHQEPALFEAIRSALLNPNLAKLIGLMAHLLYWTAFGHIHTDESRLQAGSVHSLIVTVHDSWTRLIASHRDGSHYTGTGSSLAIPALMLTAKRGIERVFIAQYPKTFRKAAYARQFLDRMNVTFMTLFDPDCAFAHFPALDCLPEVVKLWRRHSQVLGTHGLGSSRRSRLRLDRTTPAVQVALDGGVAPPGDARTRALLRRSASDAMLRPRRPASASEKLACSTQSSRTRACSSAPIPEPSSNAPVVDGFAPSVERSSENTASAGSVERPPPMDEWRRTALLRVAMQRVGPSSSSVAGSASASSLPSDPMLHRPRASSARRVRAPLLSVGGVQGQTVVSAAPDQTAMQRCASGSRAVPAKVPPGVVGKSLRRPVSALAACSARGVSVRKVATAWAGA